MQDKPVIILVPPNGAGGWPGGGHKVLPENYKTKSFDIMSWIKKQGFIGDFDETLFYVREVTTPKKFRSPDTTVR